MYHKPWERQTNEGAKAYYAFTIYRDMGPSRALGRVADRLASEGDLGPDSASGGGERADNPGFRLILHKAGEESTEEGSKRHRKQASGQIKQWSTHWGWVDRAHAWDDELDRCVRVAARNEAQMLARMQQREARACVVANMAQVGRFLRNQAKPEESERLDKIHIEDQMLVAMEATKNIPKLHEAERNAHCIRLRDMLREDGTVVTQWEFFERRPDRPDPLLESGEEAEREPL